MEKGQKIRVTFEAELPTRADDPDVREWLEFRLGANGSMYINNPLDPHELEASRVRFERV